MKKGKHGKNNRSRMLLTVLALALILGGAVGGTAAWLAADTAPVTNTFSPSTIGLKLEEKAATFPMVPGHAMAKDPRITVTGGSEDCWLFVEVEASENLGTYIAWAVNTGPASAADGVTHGGWETGESGIPGNVYYRKVSKDAADQVFAVLGGGTHSYNNATYSWGNDQVLTKPEVTLAQMTAAETNAPTLSFTAYAVQRNNGSGEFTAAQAWSQRMQ